MDAESLKDLARYQQWADGEHWKTFHENAALMEDPEIRKRLNHMLMTSVALTKLARGETPDFAAMKERESMEELESAMRTATQELEQALSSVELERMVPLPRGPKGPFEAPAGLLLLQVLLHSQHHRGQNASRMRELGAKPPMTDFILWYATGRP